MLLVNPVLTYLYKYAIIQEKGTNIMEDKKQVNEQSNLEELGSSAKELMKPENVIGVFTDTKQMFKYLLGEE